MSIEDRSDRRVDQRQTERPACRSVRRYLEFAISTCAKRRSSLIDLVSSGRKAMKNVPPQEEEHSPILIDRIQHRNRSGLPVDGDDDRRRPKNRRREHGWSSKFQLHKLVAAVGQQNASSHLPDEVISHETLYSQHPSRPVIPLLGKHATTKSNRTHTTTWHSRRMQKANRTSQELWTFTVVIKHSSTLNIRPHSFSASVQEQSWLRNYHL